ncbi:hypothetical protein NLU13_1345 [Sarocladium strictum]|uniref:Zn(2)-C6 fungal-type domain-containing protein n=1 Tax=Sarocladium strictum TaxID=5046 RepID=A0AA39LBP7_SARSR|nr:hypothetical protein NLU13_1345 [Sarocladium strictum]
MTSSVNVRTTALRGAPRRRQNRACDQCRRSKRASQHAGATYWSCSYCVKTNKECTMLNADLHELAAQHLNGLDPLPLAGVENNAEHLSESYTSGLPGSSQALEEQNTAYECEISGADCAVLDALIRIHGDQTNLSGGHGSRCGYRMELDSPATPSNYERLPTLLTRGSLSPFSIHQKLSLSFHRQMTTSNLFKIYHDVLEHHLSCWLIETTCPYRQGSEAAGALAPNWKVSWTNRILQRTIRLDNVAQACKVIRLTPSEQRAASNTLQLAVLAFATQWAQGSARARRRYSSASQGSTTTSTQSSAEDFDRLLQQFFWSHAHRALQEAADIDCYQVACAEIIFSLAQRPLHDVHQDREYESQPFGDLRSLVQSILEKDGPPVYAERAARRMHTLKVRCDSIDKGLRPKNKHLSHGSANMAPEDRDTIGLLYWLAIMFDTVAATMYERPLVVVDDECRYEIQRDLGSCIDRAPNGSYQWDYEVFLKGGSEISHRTHWPCSYDSAAEDVMMSGPIKVLLFRHVSYLQKALRQAAPNRQLEDILFNTALIYDYWNRSHGAFFQELIRNFPEVPQRIRGWFICISAHWHLAVLMLADLIEFIDQNSLGLEPAKCERLATRMVARMRENSALELSELGAVATLPTSFDMPPESPEFHHALNDGTVLTEPWTMMLIKAFSKASLFFLEEAENVRDASSTCTSALDFNRSLQKGERCIKVLWMLGKKSDMAWDLAEVLQHAMSSLRTRCIWHIM